jgi:type I restriction enzyme S subunit
VSWKTIPIKRVFGLTRRMIDPESFSGQIVFHYSLPVWHETGDGAFEPAADLASGKLLLLGNEILVSKLNPEKEAVIAARPHDEPTICSPEFIALTPQVILIAGTPACSLNLCRSSDRVLRWHN